VFIDRLSGFFLADTGNLCRILASIRLESGRRGINPDRNERTLPIVMLRYPDSVQARAVDEACEIVPEIRHVVFLPKGHTPRVFEPNGRDRRNQEFVGRKLLTE